MVYVVVAWVLVAFSCIFLAKEKRRSPFLWFILGLLFSIIAFVILHGLPSA
jgi:hypothetical protein